MAWQQPGNANSHTFPGCLNSGTRHGFERDAHSAFLKNIQNTQKNKNWAALFLVTMKLQLIWLHHGTTLPPNTFSLFIGDFFPPLLKCICKAAPPGSSFPSSSLSLSSIQGLYHTRPTPKKSGGTLQLIFGSKFFDINSLFLQSSLVSRN